MPQGYPSQVQEGALSGLQGLMQGYLARKQAENAQDAQANALRNAYLIAMGHDLSKEGAAGTGADARVEAAKIAADARKYAADHAKGGKGGSGGLSAKDLEAIQRITQGLTNLKQVEQMYKSTNAGQHGTAALMSQVPGLGRLLAGTPQFQNANPDFTNYNRSVEEAKNAYSRATFGRVSNEILAHSLGLFPPAGSDPQNTRTSLNELANTLHGVAQGLVNEKKAAGDEQGAAALQSKLEPMFGNMRFFPEMDKGLEKEPAGPGSITTTFMKPAATKSHATPSGVTFEEVP